MERHDRLRGQIAAEAADWFARLNDPQSVAQEREQFSAWLLLSPAHIEEYLAITRLWGDAGGIETSAEELISRARTEADPQNVIALLGKSSPAPIVRERKPRRYLAVAAASAAALLAGWLIATQMLDPARIATAVGEQRSLILRDGSVLFLNTSSDAHIEFDGSARRVRLLRGEARFTVAKDRARPFLVTTPHATVRAVGTMFNVRTAAELTAVTVIEGRVAVSTRTEESAARAPTTSSDPAETARPPRTGGAALLGNLELAAGQHAAVTAQGGIVPDLGPSVERVLAWSERRLIFRDERLGDVVEEFNRYHERSLRVDDPALAALRISATFDASDPDSLVQFLERYERVRTVDDAAGDRILTR